MNRSIVSPPLGGIDQRAALAALQSKFDAALPMGGTAAATASNGSTKPKHEPITSPAPSGSSSKSSSPVPRSSAVVSGGRLLNDPLKINTNNNNSNNAGQKPLESNDDDKVNASRSLAGRRCPVCKLKDPMVKASYLDHIMGKKHRIAYYKQRLTKQQKEDRDAKTLHVRGFDDRTMPEEISGLFWPHGMVDVQINKKHVFVEFATKKEAMTAMCQKLTTATGRRLLTALRTTRSHVNDKMAEEPVEFFLSPVIKNLLGMRPTSQEQLQEYVERLLNDVQMRPEEYENRQYARHRIEHFLRLEFPDVQCHIFGSSANNLGFRGADIDLYAALGYDPYDTDRQADAEAAAAKLTYYLAKHLRRQHWITNVEAIPKARVPIIKFQQSGVAVDLSFRNSMPIQNTALIRLYTYTHSLARPYMLFVRFWAKLQHVAGGAKPDTLVTNYALTMLMAFVIMQGREMLPPLAELRKQFYNRVIINGWNCGFSENVTKYKNKVHDCSILQLALEFFEYYANFDSSKWVICPLIGQLISREDMASKSMKKLPKELSDYISAPGNLQHETPLCVQDPFDLTHNLTRGLRKIPLERFQLLCKRSVAILKKIMNLEAPLVDLFQPIEVTDDMYEEDTARPATSASAAADDTNDVSLVNELITLDDSLDTSQDIEILEEVKSVISRHEKIVFESDSEAAAAGASTTSGKGSKRPSSQGTSAKTASSGTPTADSGGSGPVFGTLTDEELALCCQINVSSPSVYNMTIPLDQGFQLDMNTGEISDISEPLTTPEAVEKFGLSILEFMLTKVFGAEVERTDISGQGSLKKFKSSLDSSVVFRCFAKLTVTCKYELREGKMKLRKINQALDGPKDSPFLFEKKIAQLQLEKIQSGDQTFGRIIEPMELAFLVCHSDSSLADVLLVANSVNLDAELLSSLNFFCNSIRLLTNTCLRKATVVLNKRRTASERK